jgi:integrase
VIHYAAKMTEYTKDIDLLAGYVRQLEKEREHVIKPRIVSKEEMMRLYAASGNSPLGRCLILLGLNCGLRHADIADLRKSDINFAGMKISRPRTKTGIIQSSMLWRETVETLNQYIAKFPNNREYVFVTRFGHKYVEKYLRAEFNRVRETAGLPEITQKMLRCTVDSAANGYGINPNAIKIHMGWSISKVDNSYNERPAEATKELVAVLHKHFFE